jgi:hypothetical protein
MDGMANDAWKLFETWCRERRDRPVPADWTTLVHFLRAGVARRRPAAEFVAVIEAVAAAHLGRGLDDPSTHIRVRAELRELGLERSATSTAHLRSRDDLTTTSSRTQLPALEVLQEVPEEDLWLQGQRSAQTRRAYKADILAIGLQVGPRRSESGCSRMSS